MFRITFLFKNINKESITVEVKELLALESGWVILKLDNITHYVNKDTISEIMVEKVDNDEIK